MTIAIERSRPNSGVGLPSFDSGSYPIGKGQIHPLGATVDAKGVNFSLFSEHATSVELLLFDRSDAVTPFKTISLDPTIHRTFHFWHVYVEGLKPGVYYGYRVDGSYDSKQEHRFDRSKVLLDPYAKGISKTLWNRKDACIQGKDNLATSLRSVVIDTKDYDWEGDRPLNLRTEELIVYEMHVRGFTQSPTANVQHPGTFAGVIEKIPYLQNLGITAVELLPIFEFDQTEVLQNYQGQPLRNYWGYSTMGYFTPHSGYCLNSEGASPIRELRDMVKALHKAGIAVILDVVFNHTDEGNHQGPTFCFRGLDNQIYYYLYPETKDPYGNYSGCGNTFNCNHPIGSKFILDCLRYWVQEFHIDGFRFDEGSILSRAEHDGRILENPPVIWAIELDEILTDTKLITEPWDAGSAYQVGKFPGYRWSEWNGKYRDEIREFVKGDPKRVGLVATRIAGSSDLYQGREQLPINSVNFITAHDGFTLNDLVSYNAPHNDNNGEDKPNGVQGDENRSWNCGTEGETTDQWVKDLRTRQIKNFATILMISRGIPMLVMGDEVRRTQWGNNNAYCQDNEIGWLDWNLIQQHSDIFRFWKLLIERRKRYRGLHNSQWDATTVKWHGTKLNSPGWDDPNARVLAFTVAGIEGDPGVHVMMNMHWEPLEFELPQVSGYQWFRAIDTALPSPQDIAEIGQGTPVTGNRYTVTDRSVVLLTANPA